MQCQRIDKRVPEDISIVCLDPVQNNGFTGISFCTFGADQRLLGEIAVKKLLERIGDRSKKEKRAVSAANIVIEPTRIEGNSVRQMDCGVQREI
jgi:DNA-binding LacI/PurR family transcriptional regulator